MMYMDIPNIPGESQSDNPNWKNKIEITSMSFETTVRYTNATGFGLSASGSLVNPMNITKVMDKSTPSLFLALVLGQPLQTVAIRVPRSGKATGTGVFAGGNYEAETYILENVIVSNYHTTGAEGAGGLPEESWTLSFTKITERYQAIGPNGMLQPVDPYGYDFGNGGEYKTAVAGSNS